jgi:hypothetical protein
VHVAVEPDPDRVQGDPVKLPATPVEAKATVPVGVIGVPEAEVSATVAVQVEAWLTTTGLLHDTVVDVVLGLTAIFAVPALGE